MSTVLITGANRGIGLEFCRQYAADDWRVLACSRHSGETDSLGELERKYPGVLKLYQLDVANHAQIENLALSLADEQIDLLINNAGIYPDSAANGFGHTDYDAWTRTFCVNTMATLKMAEAFIEQVKRSKYRTIVTITSKMGSIADNDGGGSYLYRSSKAAVNMVVKNLSIDLQPYGVIAVVFHPGWVKTDMGGKDALISAERSVAGIRQVISRLTLADSGRFFGYDGIPVAW
jgi:NAD(P)-dependent dehydrogenase (short-subunit alcohol dehydrogenase family)